MLPDFNSLLILLILVTALHFWADISYLSRKIDVCNCGQNSYKYDENVRKCMRNHEVWTSEYKSGILPLFLCGLCVSLNPRLDMCHYVSRAALNPFGTNLPRSRLSTPPPFPSTQFHHRHASTHIQCRPNAHARRPPRKPPPAAPAQTIPPRRGLPSHSCSRPNTSRAAGWRTSLRGRRARGI